MTTTYELYTNENGTPKLVEGKAPAIIERVETLETSVETLEETLDNGVVTSVNGNTGDITPEQTGCLPLSGGTMTGALLIDSYITFKKGDFSAGQIRCSGGKVDRHLTIFGTPDNFDGCILQLGTSEHRDPSFILRAGDGTSGYDLIGRPNGTLTWGGNRLATMPDYSAGIEISAGGAAPTDGYVVVYFGIGGGATEKLDISGTEIALARSHNNYTGFDMKMIIPISKGETISKTCWFFPCKGV